MVAASIRASNGTEQCRTIDPESVTILARFSGSPVTWLQKKKGKYAATTA